MPEAWKDIPGFEGVYQISSEGNLRSLDRTVVHRGRNRRIKGKMLHPRLDISGYPRLGLCRGGKAIHVFAHRLVAEAFIPNPKNYPHVDHINGCKTDNRVANLRWVTHSQNMSNRHKTKQASGYAGIRYRPACTKNPYEVSGSINGQPIIIGYFSSITQALTARQKHLQEVFND